jgi:hypothetical protein
MLWPLAPDSLGGPAAVGEATSLPLCGFAAFSAEAPVGVGAVPEAVVAFVAVAVGTLGWLDCSAVPGLVAAGALEALVVPELALVFELVLAAALGPTG